MAQSWSDDLYTEKHYRVAGCSILLLTGTKETDYVFRIHNILWKKLLKSMQKGKYYTAVKLSIAYKVCVW